MLVFCALSRADAQPACPGPGSAASCCPCWFLFLEVGVRGGSSHLSTVCSVAHGLGPHQAVSPAKSPSMPEVCWA